MANRYVALPLFLLFSLPTHAQVNIGIQPVYDGENGIRAKIIQPKCLHCHSSSLSGDERGFAPSGVNFDTYELTSQHLNKIIRNTVTTSNMPRDSSLTAEQKQALSNWQVLGFPESTMPAHYTASTQTLTIPDVFLINEDGSITTKAKTGMKLAPPFTEPFRFEIQELEVTNIE